MKIDMKTEAVIEILNSITDVFKIEHPSTNKVKTLEGITNGFTEVINSLGTPINEKNLFILNRIIRSKTDELGIISPYRNIEMVAFPLSDAIEPKIVPKLMTRLLYQISDQETKLSPIEKAALVKGGIFCIQPFGDGNKRTASLLQYKILLENNLKIPNYRDTDNYHHTMNGLWKSLYKNEEFRTGRKIFFPSAYQPLIEEIKREQNK